MSSFEDQLSLRKNTLESSKRWQPAKIPGRGQCRRAFHSFMLTPGLSGSFFSAVLDRSKSSIWSYRAEALQAAKADPTILEDVDQLVAEIRPEDALAMAQARGHAQLPSWSKLAICEYQKRGCSRSEIAKAFRCSNSTVANVLQGKRTAFDLFSGARRLVPQQKNPPGKWQAGVHF
ncbi:MAG: hypothetical protein AAGH53_07435 [Pseudomonadota bacterium]